MNRILPLLTAALLVACNGDDADVETEAMGTARYADASDSTEPESSPDGFDITIEAEGTGSFDVSEPQCEADGLTGAFTALYSGEAEVDDDGVYVASLTTVEAETPSGCELPDLDIGLVTDVVVRGEVQATTQNCNTYCESKARAYGETECEGDSDEASCRSTAEADFESSCSTACEDEAQVIVAETSLTAAALSSLDVQSLTGAALGTVTADLTFDRIEDGNGNTVDEAP